MVTYSAFALNRYGLVPEQVLILLKDTAASRRVPSVFAQGRLRLEYDVVRLWELDPTPVVASRLVGLMPLVPLMAGDNLEQLLQQVTEVIQARVELPQERNEVLTVTIPDAVQQSIQDIQDSGRLEALLDAAIDALDLRDFRDRF